MFDYLRHLVSITFVIASFALSAQSPDIALHNVADSACTQSENVAPVDECQPLETQESITTMAIDDNEQQVTATRDIKLYEPPKAPDFNFIKSRTNPAVKPYKFLDDQTWVGIPLFLSGLIAKSEKTAFRQDYNNPNTKIRLIKTNFHNEIDNYTQYVPLALTIGLKIAGVESRSDWPRFWASSAASAAIMAGLVNGIKYTASEMRPDGSTRNSWPSGHTATAFLAATILHKEYGMTRSPWYSVGAYTLATATGVMRVLNNRHWISDVLSGAGIGILSVELGYGLMDLLFKNRGLQRGDLSVYPDLRSNPSFFAISMGIGLGNKNLTLPAFNFNIPSEILDGESSSTDEPLQLKFRSATAVGAEGAYFFNPYIGVGGRLRVKATPINGWSSFALSEEKDIQEFLNDPMLENSVQKIALTIESDHITEFAADAGVYFSWPFSSRFALGSKLLFGRSIMDDIDINASYSGNQLEFNAESLEDSSAPEFILSDKVVDYSWDYIDVSATNSFKFGTGISLTYAHKNNFSWRLFCDYDYSRKTFTASYNPLGLMQGLSPDTVDVMKIFFDWDMTKPAHSSVKKNLHQWVLGGALCVSF
ncbi:MAG: phosphatase PAP2 family protein [Muribaculaceae bacterium]|nr:phosphatase PAP2 family protein [Muribaculaceae bacterium]MBR0024139.1 phosphatase PAP2 family protein [Muribaculaceae bacterium]